MRVAQHQYHSPQVVDASAHSQADSMVGSALAPTIAYGVIESLFRESHREKTLRVRSKNYPLITQREGPRMQWAVIPNAMQVQVWKTPFSHGHIGTSGTKHC